MTKNFQKNHFIETHYLLKNLQSMEKFAKFLYITLKFPVTLCLIGPIGVGKTQLAKFLALYFGIRENLISSSFIKSRSYKNIQNRKLLHIDAYNSQSLAETWALINEENDVDLTIVEWAPNALFEKILPNAIVIKLNYLESFERIAIVTGPRLFMKNLEKNWKNACK